MHAEVDVAFVVAQLGEFKRDFKIKGSDPLIRPDQGF